MTPMQLQYLKISKNLYKFFYQTYDSYGEFYIRMEPETTARGSATLEAKDPEYAKDLLDGLSIALV